MSKEVGYARVSTREQNLARQIEALKQYVSSDMIVVDKASGANLDRDGYKSLKVGIGKLQSGDTLYIKSLDRLSRNKEDAKKELEYFKNNGIRVKILDMPTTMTDFPKGQEWVLEMVTNILIEVLTSIAQNERETIKQRQREGLDAMQIDERTGKKVSNKTGRVVGRPEATFPLNWDDVYSRWKNKELTARKAMELLNLKPNTFYKLVHKFEDAGK